MSLKSVAVAVGSTGAIGGCDTEVGAVDADDEVEVGEEKELAFAVDGVDDAAVADSGKGCTGPDVCAAVCAGCEDPPNHVFGDQDMFRCCTNARCSRNCGRVAP